jgi:hypothetical protein
MTSMGNPFCETGAELIILDSRNCASESVANTISSIEDIGREQYQKYVTDVLCKKTTSIQTTIKKNKLPLFNTVSGQRHAKPKLQLSNLRSDCQLFAQLYMCSCAKKVQVQRCGLKLH